MKKISELTRKDIFDIIENGFIHSETNVSINNMGNEYKDVYNEREIKMWYGGRMDEIEFLKRLYNLNKIPSNDSRFKDSEGDIWQHTVNDEDWPSYWIFTDSRFNLTDNCDDSFLLNFLCEMFHPVVRSEKVLWKAFLKKFNELLIVDGYELYEKDHISGRIIYGWREVRALERILQQQINDIKIEFNSAYVDTQVNLMYDLIKIAPHSAIGKAKELIEICSKTILEEQEIDYSTELDLIQLMRLACESIDLSAKKIAEGVNGKDIAGRILGNLANISQGMAELRNLYGDGHGKNKNFKPLPSRYANLAVGSAVTAVHFMWETYIERKVRKVNS